MLLVVACGLVGLLVGSFLNVVVWRVPRDESVIHPRSQCPNCSQPIRERDNIPVLSWLVLRGRCRDCDHPISARYPLVEGVTGLLFALTAWHFGLSWELPAFLYLVAIGVALALIDLDISRLPDKIVKPSYGVLTALFIVAALGTGDSSALERAAIGAVALYVFYFVLKIVHPKGMGRGDIKLAGLLGMALAWIGWGPLVVGAFLGFLLGGVVGGGLMAIGRANRKSRIPFGPFMITGAYVAVLVGTQISDLYVSTLPN